MAGSIEIVATPPIEEIKRKVEARRVNLRNFRTPYSRAAVFLDQWVQQNFKSEGGKVGGWAPFAKSTLDWMAHSDPNRHPAKLLQRTGRLRISFQPFATDDNAGIGSALPYAKRHQIGSGHLPARPMLPTSQAVKPDIRRIFKEFTSEVIVK